MQINISENELENVKHLWIILIVEAEYLIELISQAYYTLHISV
jgi:hypothetical protein